MSFINGSVIAKRPSVKRGTRVQSQNSNFQVPGSSSPRFLQPSTNSFKSYFQKHSNSRESSGAVPLKMEETDKMIPYPTIRVTQLSLQQILLLNMVVCGLEFCASAAFTYIPPMLLKAGIEEEHMSLILGIGPLLGFFFVPVIGQASDQCRSKYGRRRPFIFGLGCLLLFSLMIIPYGEVVATYAFGKSENSKTIGIAMLIVGAVLLDFTSQAGLTPCEALLSDASRNTNQQDRAFTVYSFMVSLGGCIGYLITALDWSTSSVGIYFGGQEQSAFSVLIVLFSLALFTTLLVAEERPITIRQPSNHSDKNDKDEEVKKTLDQIHQALVRDKEKFSLGHPDPGYETSSNQSACDEYQASGSPSGKMHSNLENLAESPLLPNSDSDEILRCPVFFNRRQCNIPLTRWSFTTYEGLCHLIGMRIYKLLPRSFKTLLNSPSVLKRLALANFCAWSAVMSFNLFYTDYVGQAVYGGNPNAAEDSHERSLYDEGVRMASWGLLFHCITSAIYATCVDYLVTKYSLRNLYCIGMLSFSMAMCVMVFVHNIYIVNLMAACTGFAYATVTTIPFMLIQGYHTEKEIFFFERNGSRAVHGIGTDLSTLDSAYFMSQVILTAFMGYLVYYTGTVLTYVVIAGSAGIVACVCSTRIITSKQEMTTYMRTNRLDAPNYVDI